MLATREELSTLLVCLRATGLPLLMSSVLSLCVGVCLAELRRRLPHSRKVYFLVFVHFLPLFIPPVLLVAVLTSGLQDVHCVALAQSVILLAGFGYLFHTGIAFALVSYIFNWNDRIDTIRRLSINLPSRRAISIGIYLSTLWSVLLFSLVALFILQESMLSAPFFTGQQTLVSVVQGLTQDSSIGTDAQLPALIILIASFIVTLLSAYWLPKLAGREVLLRIASTRDVCPMRLRGQSTNKRGTIAAISVLPTLSSISILVAAVFALTQLLWRARGATLLASLRLLNTLRSYSVMSGMVSVAILLTFVLIAPPARKTNRRTFDPTGSLAFLPPALLGTVGLALTFGPVSLRLIVIACIGGYAYLRMRLFLNPSSLCREHQLFGNARNCGLTPSHFGVIVLASKVGGILPAALFGLYMLWIEDGIQVSMLGHSNNLATAVRGLKLGVLPNNIYAGSLVTFVAWIVLALGCHLFTTYRFKWLHKRLAIRSTVNFAVLIYLVVLLIPHCGVAQQHSRSTYPLTCQLDDESLRSGDKPSIYVPGCNSVDVKYLVVSSGAVHLYVPSTVTKLRVERLSFQKPQATLYIEGQATEVPLELQIDDIEEAPNAPKSELRFHQIRFSRLSLTGEMSEPTLPIDDGGPSIWFMPGSSAQDIHLHRLASPEINLAVHAGGNNSIHLESVDTRSIYIHGESDLPAPRNHDEGEASSDLGTGTAVQRPSLSELTFSNVHMSGTEMVPARLSIEGVALTGGQIDLRGRSRVQMQLTHVTIEPSATSTIQLEGDGEDVRAEVRGEDILLDGTLSIRVLSNASINSLIFDSIRASRAPDYSQLLVDGSAFNSITLNDLALSKLELCGDMSTGKQLDLSIRNVTIQDDVTVPTAWLRRNWNTQFGPTERSLFLRTLQERGDYCVGHVPIGLDALYFRKKRELAAAHPFVSILVDHLTGFGVDLNRAFTTFIILLCCHFVSRILVLILSLPTENRSKGEVKKLLEQALAGTFTIREHGKHSPRLTALLEAIRLCFSWIIFIQITLCSIYLSQTTLQ